MRKIAELAIVALVVLLLIPAVQALAVTINGKTYYYNPASGRYVPYPVTIEEPANPQAVKPQATTTSGTTSVSENNGVTLVTPNVPIPMWSINYATYTAQFIGEDKVVVYTAHGDMDLGYRYISVHPNGYAYIYDVKTGKLLKSFSGGTTGGTWDLSSGTKIWDRSGFFSGNGRFLVEDPQAYGTSARVVDLETKTTYPINWTGTAGVYYATQMDYYGKYIAVGEWTNSGRLLVFESNGSAYNLIWNSTPIGQVRRLFMTLDAQYIIYGALGHPYLHIAEKVGDTYEDIARIPLAGGVGALTCTDPWHIGLILVGTDNGHIYIFDTHNGTKVSDPDLVIHLDPSQTGTTGRFYNPFYNRWNPKKVTVVAFSTWTDPYVTVLIDLKTGRYWRYTGSGYGKASTVSLQGNYVFAGRTLYMIVKQDVQSGKPRIRFIGDLVYDPSQNYPVELNSAFTISAPKNKPYHVYFQSGKIKITYVEADQRPVVLTTDPDIRDGKFGKMLDKGLIKYGIIYTDGASVENNKLIRINDSCVAYTRVHVLKRWTYARFIGVKASTADSGIIIKIPLGTKISPYSELHIDPKFAVSVIVPQFNPLGELIGVGGVEIAGSGISFATARSLSKGWLRSYLSSLGYDELAIHDAEGLLARAVTRVGSKLCIIAGVAMIIDTGASFYTHWQDLKKYENIFTTVYTIPIFVDTKTGEKYAVVDYYLPQQASSHEEDFRNHVISYMEKLGIPKSNVVVRITYLSGVNTWEEYMKRIEEGKIPKADLLDLARTIPVPTDRLRIDEIVIVVDTITQGYASTFDLLGGGFKEAVGTVIFGGSIEVSGIISSFHTKDPSEIASLIPKVEVNGELYDVSPSTDGAIAQFALPIGTNSLVIKFPNAEHLRAVFKADIQALVKVDMVDKGGYYEAEFHYDWKHAGGSVTIITKRMEFVDMPYPMVYAERLIILKHGRVEALHGINKYFELKQVINDSSSPSGKRYYYVTQNPRFLDPSNGARMETCKKYIFKYWYVAPPVPYRPKPNETLPINGTQPLPKNYTSKYGDAWVKLYLNGTTNTSTIPRMLVVWLGSTGAKDNTVKVKITMRAGYLDEHDRPVYTMNKTVYLTKTLSPNSTYVQFYDIQKFIAEAISHAPRGFFEGIAEIVQADYNSLMSDDYDRVTYFPPASLPHTGQPVILNVKVINAVNLTPVEGATVYVDGNVFGTTNVSGWANGTTTVGLHTIKVVKSGYETYEESLNVFDNMSVTIELIPTGFPIQNYHKLEVLVVYADGAPYKGALVKVIDNATKAVIFNQTTDSLGLADFVIEAGKVVDVNITAGNYTFNFTGITMSEDRRVVATVPVNSSYFTPEVGISNVTFKIHWGMGWYYGKTPQLVETWVFSNVPQTVTLHYRAFDVNTNETLNETDLTVTLHKGMNYIMNWVYLGVRNESKNVAVEVTITKYQYDTDPYNNRMVSNSVMIKPFVDLAVTVLWKPIKQKTPFAILPNDVIEVDVGFIIPCKLTGVDVNVSINAHDLEHLKHFSMKPVQRYRNKVSAMKPNTTIWYNTTIVVPFTDEIIVNASINHPWDYNGWNNYINTTIPVFPDTAVEGISIGSLIVRSGGKTSVTVRIKSNAIGRGATVSVDDIDADESLGIAHITITKPDMEITLTANVPKIASVNRTTTQSFNISGMYETHTWNVSVATVDYWAQNNYKTFKVTIWAIPWWVWALVILIIAILVLVIILRILLILRTRFTPKYRFFRKLGGEEGEVADRFSMTAEEKRTKKFRFFKRLK